MQRKMTAEFCFEQFQSFFSEHPVKVLIVDDSRIFRHIVEESLKDIEGIEVVGSVRNGLKALEFIQKNGLPDVISLDVEMPEMDGLETLQEVKKINDALVGRKVHCIMLSALTQAGSEATIQALCMGAYDFIAKPTSDSIAMGLELLKKELITKIHSIFDKSEKKIELQLVTKSEQPDKLDQNNQTKSIVIGCSTGGPRALLKLIPELCELTELPILVVQHMPPTFTKSLAESIDKVSKHKVIEAQGGEFLKNKMVYIAPGGRHMNVKKEANGSIQIGVNDQEPENGCRPSVDVLFRSAAAHMGKGVVAVILTGMGSDGAKGIAPLHRVGAHIMAQDDKSSVVWGMPGAAVESGYVHEVVPLDQMAQRIINKVG